MFKVIDNNAEIVCTIVKLLNDESNRINYIIYTDGTKDESGNDFLYASRYTKEGNDYILKPIENDYEWNFIDNMLSLEIGDY
jgi:uncharacterized protein YrzB (UPF0473 family)